MKAIVVILAVSVVAVLGGFTDEQRARLKVHRESCTSEVGVNPTAIDNVKRGKIDENDKKLACFFKCLLQKFGILSADEHVDWEVVQATVIPPNVSQDQVDQIINKCQNVDGTGCQKATNLVKCFFINKTFNLYS